MSIPLPLALAMDRAVGFISGIANNLPAEHPDTRDELEAYLDKPFDVAFPAPPVPNHAHLSRFEARRGYTVEEFRFDSAFEPMSAHYKERHEHDYIENRHVVGRIYRHDDGHPRVMVIYIHGLMQPGPVMEERVLIPRILKKLDVDVCHLHLPFHGRRKPANELIHGGFFWTSDLVRSFEAIRQSVSDVRSVIYYLRERFNQPIGLVGMSLGGVITMTTVCVEKDVDFAIPVIAHQSLSDAVTRAPILTRMREELNQRGLSEADLIDIESRLGLSRMKPVIPTERMLWINARHDLIIRADAVERQWRDWGEPPIRWYEGSHMSIVFEIPQVMGWIGEYLDDLALVPRHGMRRRRAA
ncbi:MAG: hypothetical protein KDH09_15855 [Chrysiogenetes bacterium]|nr:hypothetical protein [Chrysiogenetes bacterium]